MNLSGRFSHGFFFIFLLAGSLLLAVGANYLIQSSQTLPLFYILGTALLLGLAIEAFVKRNQMWGIPSLTIYATVTIWYFIDLIYWSPEKYYNDFSIDTLESSYLQIIVFLLSFRVFVSIFNSLFRITIQKLANMPSVNPGLLLGYLSIIWLGLLIFGISRLNGDILSALFPLNARAGVHMWQRAAGASAGTTGFLVSSASYIYILVCSFFGILLPLQARYSTKFINLSFILISWPYFLLNGTRNQFLAVSLPAYFTYLILSKQKWWLKLLLTVAAFMALNYAFTIVIEYRNVGFNEFFQNVARDVPAKQEQKHLGLNMLEELCFINSFYQQKLLHLSYGGRYITELLNFVPRAIWHNKPFSGGFEYAILRGFSRSNNDVGVVLNVLPGLIGQGVMDFGPLLGPLAPALLMALWAMFLARLWSQRYSILRFCLFLTSLAVTFNLGRGITLIVLWPILFGYALVLILENLNARKKYYL